MIVAFGCGVGRIAAAQPANKDDLAATVSKLNKKALDEYDNLNFEEARKILRDALDFCREAGLDQHPVTARTNLHLGVVVLTGFKQRAEAAKFFRKALEIQPDIKMTKSLANPEIQAAFDEVAASMASGSGTSKPSGAVAVRSGADSGISHEPVTRAARGQGIPISATLDPALNADKVTLWYRGVTSADFTSHEMREATPGNFIAEIPGAATGGSAVAYFIEAGRGAQLVATLGSKTSPLLVTLASSSTPIATLRRPGPAEPAAPSSNAGPSRFYAAVSVGTGLGWTSGSGELNSIHQTKPAGFGAAQLGHVAPEFGYFLTPDLILSVQARIQFLSGLTACDACAPAPSTAVAAFAKLTWLFGSSELRPYLSASVGGGRIRHVADFASYPKCGTVTCVDSIAAGPVLLGPGTGIIYSFTPSVGLVAALTSQFGFPDFTFNVDLNLGLAAQF